MGAANWLGINLYIVKFEVPAFPISSSLPSRPTLHQELLQRRSVLGLAKRLDANLRVGRLLPDPCLDRRLIDREFTGFNLVQHLGAISSESPKRVVSIIAPAICYIVTIGLFLLG